MYEFDNEMYFVSVFVECSQLFHAVLSRQVFVLILHEVRKGARKANAH